MEELEALLIFFERSGSALNFHHPKIHHFLVQNGQFEFFGVFVIFFYYYYADGQISPNCVVNLEENGIFDFPLKLENSENEGFSIHF